MPDSIVQKPVSFYLDHPKVAAIAKALYRGEYRPTDNDSTTQLLSYVIIDDSILRPFYRWCLDFTIAISDGALGDYPGVPALQYATKFPQEFFNYIDKDKSGQRYKQWTVINAYSGLDNYDKPANQIQDQIATKMLRNCIACNDSTRRRIDAFAKHIATTVKLQD